MKNILTKKAMTLFELLAVIVILGIILAIGFPTVNRLIDNSRKDAFAANVNSYISAAKTDALAEWAAKGESVEVTYEVNDINFGIEVFNKGQITIVVNEEGEITITLDEPFEGAYVLDVEKGVEITNEQFTRDNIKKVGN